MSSNYPSFHHFGSNSSLSGANNSSLQEMNTGQGLNCRSTPSNQSGDVKLTSQLVEQIAALYLNEDCSDFLLVIEGQRLPVHKVILAARSVYFHAMLYGGMRESMENEVTLVETPVESFKILLKYIYTGKLHLHSLELNLVLDILGLVHRYGFTELEKVVPDYLKSILKNRNVCAIFAVALHYSIDGLLSACLDFIDNCASELLTSQAFLDLPAHALIQIIRRNSFSAPELEIFDAVKRWFVAHPDESEQFEAIKTYIRLPLIKLPDLYGHIRESGLISAERILDAIKDQGTKRSSELNYRGFLYPGINVATAAFGAKVVVGVGDIRTSLLATASSCEDENHSSNDRYAKHLINPRDPGITVELGRPFILNNIKLHLMDRDQRTYSYYIEVSMDKTDWVRIIDHTDYLCRSRQNLLFEARVVKFIRVVGTYSSINNTFQMGNFESIFTTEPFNIDAVSTLQIPSVNVATMANNALVIEGVSRSRNALLNGDVTSYDWDNGYTCHQLGSGALVVQLPQPYLIESIRMLLWDCDDRCYSFYIEVSSDQVKWTKIAEVNERRSWQIIKFERLPMVYIRIVGTYNSANEVFHCVHFECPAMESNPIKEQERIIHLRQKTTIPVEAKPLISGIMELLADQEIKSSDDKIEEESIDDRLKIKSTSEAMQDTKSPNFRLGSEPIISLNQFPSSNRQCPIDRGSLPPMNTEDSK